MPVQTHVQVCTRGSEVKRSDQEVSLLPSQDTTGALRGGFMISGTEGLEI